ncbi:hypothetical protein CS006_08560 [Bifidobacterium primatium]|uniref:Uncharacterized protein n=1 Tax=Bifidobacterium primatium TaxID=2045438 RepID=A0A2M9H745_9BIFI|nr:DUF6725 family protein [Bifidobacterium primatium]PJM72615.1 hypothetical protein CS006_08560 [Bifidobacterium primatium]
MTIVHIPVGARLVVRTTAGTNEEGREQYRDFVGHVTAWDGVTLSLLRDESANGRRPAQLVDIKAADIVRFKPVPERPTNIERLRAGHRA